MFESSVFFGKLSVFRMFRVIFFWATGGSILLGAGFLPTPSSENFPDFLKSVPEIEISIPDITGPDQPALLAEIGNLVLDLPVIGEQIEQRIERTDPVASTDPEQAVETPQTPRLPTPSTETITVAQAKSAKTTSAVTPDVTVATAVNFDFDTAELDTTAKAELAEFSEWLSANPTVGVGIFGHTDLTGPETYNNTLGQIRAEQVADYLLSNGISKDRIRIIRSLGEQAPVVKTEGASRENRRVKVETMRL